MIALTFSGSDQRVAEHITAAGPRIIDSLVAKLNALDAELQAKIVGELSGEILKRHTGIAAGSIRALPARSSGGTITGTVQGGGGPAYYLAIQEEGSDHEYPILPKNKKALAFFPQGSAGAATALGTGKVAQSIFAGKRGVNRHIRAGQAARARFGSLGGVVVKGVIHPPIEARHPLAKAQEEFAPQMLEGLRETLARSLNQ
jgi:hypothetical protein